MKALIVEDHPQTAQLLAQTLRLTHIEPEICCSAEDAIELLSERSVSAFDFYFLDLQLPGANGISLCEWIRKQTGGAAPYVTVATGTDFTEILADAFEAGADDYLEKPFTPKILTLRLAVAREQMEVRRERHRLNKELNREKDFIAAVFDTAAACIVALDRRGRIVKVNQATIDLIGRKSPDLKESAFADVLTTEDTGEETGEADKIAARLKGLAEGYVENCQFESVVSVSGRSTRHLTWHCRRVEDQSALDAIDQNEALIVCVGTDITERRKMEARLAFLAKHDPLTNLYNRTQLEPAVRRAIHGARSCSNPAALMCIDLDHFKTVNDTAGHAAGDKLLRIVASTLSEITRPMDTVIRLGGDEFVLVLPDTPKDQIQVIAERIRTGIDELRFEVSGRVFRVTASIGVAMLKSGTSVADALARADSACYTSKNSGRNQVHIAPSPTRRSGAAEGSPSLFRRLSHSLEADEIELWGQPIVSTQDGKIVFHEALLRPFDCDGYLAPEEFWDAAQRFHLLPRIDRIVIRKACALVQKRPDLNLTINLTGITASNPRLPEFLETETQRCDVAPQRLIFEITESELISDLAGAVERLTELNEKGFRFALDDFGKGYSSFSYLRNLPVEMVKIDGAYTRSLVDDPASTAFIKSIAELAHTIGIRCVAEHVETIDAFRAVGDLGVEYAQGYYLGKPRLLHASHKPETIALAS